MAEEPLPPLRIREADGAPNLIPVFDLILSNNLGLVQRGGGIVALTVTTGGGGSTTVYSSTGGSYITFALETDLTAERNIVAGMGISFADSGAGGNLVIHPNTSLLVTSGRTLTAGLGIDGGGDLSANRTFDADTALLVTSGRTISAGAGLSGGGNLSADRTISLVTPVAVASGGTGTSSLTNRGFLVGSGGSAIQVIAALNSGELVVGSSTIIAPQILGAGSQGTMLVANSALRLGIAWVATGGAGTSFSIPLIVGSGGTGQTTLTNRGIMIGSGANAVQVLTAMNSGELVVGSSTTVAPQILASGAQGQFLVSNSSLRLGMSWINTAAAGITGTNLSSIQVVRKTSDQVVNNTVTLTDDTQLLISLAANENAYAFFFIRQVGNATADFRASFSVPTGATIRWNDIAGVFVDAAASITNFNDIIVSNGERTFYADTDTRGIPQGYRVSVRNSSNTGNLQFRWAQGTATVVDTKVLTDSFLVAFRE